METEKVVPHGTLYGYAGFDCRCQDCKDASREYARKYRSTASGRQASRRSASRNNYVRQASLAWVRANHPEVVDMFVVEWEEKTRQPNTDMQ
jgi:hypothetical protein